jgi:uncharacterized protein CbrC (UPF0167 family)
MCDIHQIARDASLLFKEVCDERRALYRRWALEAWADHCYDDSQFLSDLICEKSPHEKAFL